MTKPTVGRVVHFYTSQMLHQSNGLGEGPYAAIISQVHSDPCVSLTVFPPFIPPYSASNVMEGTAQDSGNRWCWPPRE